MRVVLLVAGYEEDGVSEILDDCHVDVMLLEEFFSKRVQYIDDKRYAISVETSEEIIGIATTTSRLENARHLCQMLCSALGRSLDVIELAMSTPREGRALLFSWIVKRLLCVHQEVADDVTAVRQALVTLRLEHEETLERFASIEKVMTLISTPATIEKLYMPPAMYVKELENGVRLRQLLPVQARGMTSFDIFLGESFRSGDGVLSSTLFISSKDNQAYKWSTPGTLLSAGRNTFRLPIAIAARERDPILELSWSGSGTIPISLSDPNPLDEFCAVVDGYGRLNAPIALSVVVGIPGVRAHDTDENSKTETIADSATEPPSKISLSWALTNSKL